MQHGHELDGWPGWRWRPLRPHAPDAPGQLRHPAGDHQGHRQADADLRPPLPRILIFFMVRWWSSTPSSAWPTRSCSGTSSTRDRQHDTQLIIGLAAGGGGPGPGRRRALHRRSGGCRPRSARASSSTCGPRSSSTSRRCPRLLHPDPDRGPRHPVEQRRARGPAGLHRHLSSVVSNLSRWAHAGHHVLPVLADHPGRPGPPAHLPGPGPRVGRRWPSSPGRATGSTPR